MRCDAARRAISDHLDAPVEVAHDDLDQHLAGCAACRTFAQRLETVRRPLHLQPVGAAPDVAPRVRAQLEARHEPASEGVVEPADPTAWRRRLLPAAAAVFVAAFALSASVVGLSGPPDAGAVDVSSLVLDSQTDLGSLHARVEVVEHGWHPAVPTRTYHGSLTYAAPESLHLELSDGTDYPDASWPPNDVSVVVDGPRAWGSGRERCPAAGLPSCIPARPQVRAVEGREPFDPDHPVPLDLVLPVASFAIGGGELPLPDRHIDGRAAVGVEVTAAQLAPLLDGIHRYGNWRPIHPTDRAAVWLDEGIGIPLLVEVRAGSGPQRDRWSATHGLDDEPGQLLLSWRLADLRVDGTVPPPPYQPAGADVRDRGFRDGHLDDGHLDDGHLDDIGPSPSWLPDGMATHRQGRRGDTVVTSYADGRAWVSIRSTLTWERDRLFGHAVGVVRRVGLDDAGVGYTDEDGSRVLIHGDGIDVEVVGSLPTDELLRVAAGLGVEGRPVPASWAEASTATIAEAVMSWPALLTVPEPLDGYAEPGVAVSETGVVQSFVGAGDRAFTLSQVHGDTLGPPMDAHVVTYDLRGRTARYTPGRGTLEWVENGHVVTLRSRTVGVAELIAIAEALEVAG